MLISLFICIPVSRVLQGACVRFFNPDHCLCHMTYYNPRSTYAQRGICYTDAMGKDRKTSEEMRQAIADRLRELREKHGYKQVDVAAVIGIMVFLVTAVISLVVYNMLPSVKDEGGFQ